MHGLIHPKPFGRVDVPPATHIWIVAPTHTLYAPVATALLAAGYDVGSTWARPPGRKELRQHDPAYLSTEQLRTLADDIMAGLVSADIVVSVHSRNAFMSSFWAGAARARGIPVLIVGPQSDPALEGSGLDYSGAEPEDVVRAIKKMVDRHARVLQFDQPFDTLAQHRQNVADAISKGRSAINVQAYHNGDRSAGSLAAAPRSGAGGGGAVDGDGAGI